jgi:hypothetical protein
MLMFIPCSRLMVEPFRSLRHNIFGQPPSLTYIGFLES